MDLKGKTALVTGASSGIGQEFCIQLHSLGARVLLLARRTDRIEQLASEFNVIRDNSAEAFTVDLCEDARDDSTVYAKFLKYIATQPIDLLVNNAGRGSFGCYEEIDLESEIDMIRLNIEATSRLAHAVIPGSGHRFIGITHHQHSFSQPINLRNMIAPIFSRL